MDRDTRIELSVIYTVKEALHRVGCNTIEDGYQPNLYRTELPYVVKVVEGWPEGTERLTLPTVAVYHDSRQDNDLQIGGGYWVRSMFYVEIFANRDNERNFLCSTIYEYLKDTTEYVLDYDIGFPYYQINSGESVLSDYYPSGVATAESDLWFEEVRSRNIFPIGNVGEVKDHRAQIQFTAVSIR